MSEVKKQVSEILKENGVSDDVIEQVQELQSQEISFTIQSTKEVMDKHKVAEEPQTEVQGAMKTLNILRNNRIVGK